jgi:hypothetical protein
MDMLDLARKLGLVKPFEILADGGIVVQSPDVSSEMDEIWCRTVVELDGDVITSIRHDKLDSLAEIEVHFTQVRSEVQASVSAVRRLMVALGTAAGLAVFGIATGASVLDGTFAVWDVVISASLGVITAVALVVVRQLRSRLLNIVVPRLVRYVMVRSVGTVRLEDFQAGTADRGLSLF